MHGPVLAASGDLEWQRSPPLHVTPLGRDPQFPPRDPLVQFTGEARCDPATMGISSSGASGFTFACGSDPAPPLNCISDEGDVVICSSTSANHASCSRPSGSASKHNTDDAAASIRMVLQSTCSLGSDPDASVLDNRITYRWLVLHVDFVTFPFVFVNIRKTHHNHIICRTLHCVNELLHVELSIALGNCVSLHASPLSLPALPSFNIVRSYS